MQRRFALKRARGHAPCLLNEFHLNRDQSYSCMALREFLLGRPLKSEEQEGEKIGPVRGIPILGLDALASASYGPEAALTVLIVFGAAGSGYIGPISATIVAVLAVVFVSYRQT